MRLFEDEFEFVPPELAFFLGQRLEELILTIAQRHRDSIADPKLKNYTAEQLSGMISTIFDLAERAKIKKE